MPAGFGDMEVTVAWIRVVCRGGQRQKPDQENVKSETPKKFCCERERVFWLLGGMGLWDPKKFVPGRGI